MSSKKRKKSITYKIYRVNKIEFYSIIYNFCQLIISCSGYDIKNGIDIENPGNLSKVFFSSRDTRRV